MFARKLAILTALAAIGAAAPLSAQETAPPAHISFNTGLFQFDLSGTGYSPMVAVRAATPIAHVLQVEGALLAARPGQQFATTTYLVPEAQIQLVLPFSVISPYMGLGAGAAIDFRDDEFGGTQADLTISGSLGIKGWVSDSLGAQAELRARGVELDFVGSTSEWTLGLLWRI